MIITFNPIHHQPLLMMVNNQSSQSNTAEEFNVIVEDNATNTMSQSFAESTVDNFNI